MHDSSDLPAPSPSVDSLLRASNCSMGRWLRQKPRYGRFAAPCAATQRFGPRNWLVANSPRWDATTPCGSRLLDGEHWAAWLAQGPESPVSAGVFYNAARAGDISVAPPSEVSSSVSCDDRALECQAREGLSLSECARVSERVAPLRLSGRAHRARCECRIPIRAGSLRNLHRADLQEGHDRPPLVGR